MNKKQVAYQMGRLVNNNCDLLLLGITAIVGYHSVDHFVNSQISAGLSTAALSLCAGYDSVRCVISRLVVHDYLKELRTRPASFYPIEQVPEVIIDDLDGLEFLLSKTRDGESKEWGTFLKAHHDQGRAVVGHILDVNLAKQRGLIGKGSRSSLHLDTSKAYVEGYNGYHHYHPGFAPRWLGAMNFSISLVDRVASKEGWINLLTFNLPEGPEIVGFNRQYVYIPKDASRRELIRATPGQVMEYLRAA